MLVIRDLTKIYPGPVTALAGVDLNVPNGMFGLLGPNGAGNTTLMRILAGVLAASSGTATLDGEPMRDRPERIWERLSYLPQDFGCFPHMTGERMLEYLLQLKGLAAPGGVRALCRELLERVNLSFAARRKVKTYSGGMRQRLGIAQAIAGDPRLVIVDEPTAGLRPRGTPAILPLAVGACRRSDRRLVDSQRRGRGHVVSAQRGLGGRAFLWCRRLLSGKMAAPIKQTWWYRAPGPVALPAGRIRSSEGSSLPWN
jgi:ABC-type Na+ transport system ATPase subunit NatA